MVEELSIPQLKVGQVLVKIAFSGVCRSQLMEVRGNRGVAADDERSGRCIERQKAQKKTSYEPMPDHIMIYRSQL